MNTRVFRFAPSPNGRLHLGHALSALLNADMNAVLGGTLVVGVVFIAVNLLTDIIGRLADPRVR